MRCEVQWINCKGEPTPDENEATHLVHVLDKSGNRDGRCYLVCPDHLRNLLVGKHHEDACRHYSQYSPARAWDWELLPPERVTYGGVG
jgi:hypothetical protein